MRLTFRAKLTVLVGVASLAFLIIIVSGAILGARTQAALEDVRQRFVPRMEVGPRLESDLEHLGRALQDAVAAHDPDALAHTHALETQLLQAIAAARGILTPGEVAV